MGSRLLRAALVLLVLLILMLRVRIEVRKALDAYFRGDTVVIPDLRGLAVDKARRMLGADLVAEVARQTYDPRVPKGVIISQDPPPEIRVRAGKTVFLRISRGADLQRVPEVVGKDLRKASIELRNVGLQVGNLCFVRDRRAKNGAVLNQSPRAGHHLGRGGRVDLLIASSTREGGGVVPRVEGLPREEASAALKSAGIRRIHLLEQPSEDHVPGRVIVQEPPGGTLFDENTVLELGVAIPPGSGPARKLLEPGYHLPPGLQARTLQVVVEDDSGRRVVHKARHLPGEHVSFATDGRGEVRVEYYLDDLRVEEEVY